MRCKVAARHMMPIRVGKPGSKVTTAAHHVTLSLFPLSLSLHSGRRRGKQILGVTKSAYSDSL
jgi:hypothetical protein